MKKNINALKAFLQTTELKDLMEYFDEDELETLAREFIESRLSKFIEIKSALEAIEKNQVLEARKALGNHDPWAYMHDSIVSMRGTIKSLISGYLFISLGHLKRNPEKIYSIWEYYISMYMPHVKRSERYEGFFPHIGNIHLYNFHHFILYQRFLQVDKPGTEVDNFMAFYKDYLFEMFRVLASLLYNAVVENQALAEESGDDLHELFAETKKILPAHKNDKNFQVLMFQGKKQFCCKPDSTNIRTLNNEKFAFFYGEKISELPEEVFDKTDLELLIICRTKIREIPDEIKKLSNLKRVHFSGSKLEYLSPEVFKLPQISEIDIIDPQYESNAEITEAIGQFMAKHNDYFFGKNCWNMEVWGG